MKYLLIILSLLVCNLTSFAKEIHDTIPVYNPTNTNPGLQLLKIPVDFNEAVLPNGVKEALEDQTVERVDLVYTAYRESQSFDQIRLNTVRKRNLLQQLPPLASPIIQWHVIGQNGASDKETARSLFHGFVVYYRARPTEESMKKEIDFIETFLAGEISLEDAFKATVGKTSESSLSKEKAVSPPTYEIMFKSIANSEAIQIERNPSCIVQNSGIFRGDFEDIEHFADSLRTMGFFDISYKTNADSGDYGAVKTYSYTANKYDPDCESTESLALDSSPFSLFPYSDSFYNYDPGYSIVQATFERNPTWKNTQVIIDVTGSMSPYIAQTFAWVKTTQDEELVSAFTFFNDGNSMPDRQKRAGSVGGIYSTRNTSFEKVKKTMTNTMIKGGGGDCPENNIEAVLHALNKFPDCDEIVLVADNYATPRDLALLKEVDRPIHIILCGAQYGINIEYVRAAYRTGGSVHTIEEDMELRNIEPGSSFQIGNTYFTLKDGQIFMAQRKA